MDEWHARTPGHRHKWLRIQLGATHLGMCSECDFWYIQPSLPALEPEDQGADEGDRDSDRHPDEDARVAAAESDAAQYYRAKHSSF